MDRWTKALLIGVTCGLLVAGVGVVNTFRLERKVETLTAACIAERDKPASAAPGGRQDGVPDNPLGVSAAPNATNNEAQKGATRSAPEKQQLNRYGLIYGAPRAADVVMKSAYCEADLLAVYVANHALPGVQGELGNAQRALDFTRYWSLGLGAAIAAVLGLPWFWYFLLKRVKELRQALIGE